MNRLLLIHKRLTQGINMKNLVKLTTTLTLTAVIAACSSTPNSEDLNSDIPDWVMNPVVEGSFSAAACVPSSGHMSIDRANATALSRVDLAQQINTKVQALDKTYQERINVDQGTQVGSTFSSVSKQLADQSLVGSRVIKTAYANFDSKNQLCVLTSLGAQETKKLFDNLLKESERSVTPDQERVLYQEFKAYKAQQELDAELQKNN